MRLIKRFFLVTGLVILKLTQPLIPAKNPNSLNFYGTEGVVFQEDTGFGGFIGGNIKIAPPNRFARLKTFSCNRQFEKPQTLFLEKSLVLRRKWIFFWGGKYWGCPKNGFWHDSIFSCNTWNKKRNVQIENPPHAQILLLSCQWETNNPNKIN